MNYKYWAIYFKKGIFKGYMAVPLIELKTKEELQELMGDEVTVVSIVKEIN